MKKRWHLIKIKQVGRVYFDQYQLCVLANDVDHSSRIIGRYLNSDDWSEEYTIVLDLLLADQEQESFQKLLKPL